jgi:hypothetical protein
MGAADAHDRGHLEPVGLVVGEVVGAAGDEVAGGIGSVGDTVALREWSH